MSPLKPAAFAVLHPVALPASSRGLLDRSSGAILLTSRTGVALLAIFVISTAAAQMQGTATQPGVIELLIKWTPLLAQGFLFNILISILAMVVGTVAGVLLGFARISHQRPVRGTSWLVVQFFRNAPWLVLLFFVMFLMPFELRIGATAVPFPDWIKATLGLALPIMANIAEIVRGAVQSIPTGQWEAARSLAFSRRQTLWQIILPQCLKRMLPPWMNWYAILTMATTLASIVGVSEVMTLTGRITNAEARTDFLIPVYTYVLLWFFVYCYPISLWTRRLEARFAER
ncbi:MAG: amino acid ABC transporter permease [Pseudomonadota bacterium]|nr:amino acid ABC transporter permease [Pseudomonadota bacterium]